MPPCEPSWLPFVSVAGGVLSAIAAAGAVWVAWRQYVTQDQVRGEQLRIALFDKRYTIMMAAGEMLSKVGRDASLDHFDVLKLRSQTAMASCLFEEEIVTLIDAITDRAFRFVVKHREVDRHPPNSPAREAACDEEGKLLGLLMEDLRSLQGHFAPYFTFREG